MNDFDYLRKGEVYLDSACQSLRPRPVITTLNQYYTEFNSCGERVKYPWGIETDRRVNGTREKVLKYLKLSPKNYFVSFTLNTTYGINLILLQLKKKQFSKIITSEIEHNSPFLSSIAFAKRTGLPRYVLPRKEDGALILSADEFSEEKRRRKGINRELGEKKAGSYRECPGEEFFRDGGDLSRAVVVVNAASNIDGRKLVNIREVCEKVHTGGGVVIIDAAQAMAHSADILRRTEADAICFSAHKMYAPSLGGIVIRKTLLKKLKPGFLGGGMVDDVSEKEFLLSSEKNPEHLYTRFEPGLQGFGETVALGEATNWLEKTEKKEHKEFERRYTEIFEFLKSSKKVKLVNNEANPTMSFYIEGLDSHLLGGALGEEKIMARTGYFCAHYYLDKVRNFPPLIRFSMGYHNRDEDVIKIKKLMENIV